MSANPYESPKAHPLPRSTVNAERISALRSVRIALLILLVPAIYNFICFNFPSSVTRIELPTLSVYRTANLIGLVFIVLASWFFGLYLFEFMAGGLYWISARRAKLDDWWKILYVTLRRAPVFAFFGAVLWTIWVAAFYQLGVGFYTVSVPIGVAAHLLAAGFYLPLFYCWYKMERSVAG